MQIVRFQSENGPQTGVVEDGLLRLAQGDLFGRLATGPVVGEVSAATLLPPVIPSKLIAIGLNYHDHIVQDSALFSAAPSVDIPENPIIFLKPPSALVGSGAPIVLPRGVERTDAEAELAIVIGRRCRNVRARDAYDVILGFCPSNDVSARDHQFKDGQWSRAKGYDTFAPLGPAIVTDINADDLAITCRVNGEVRQSSRTSMLIFNIPTLIEFISSVMTLEPGDVIVTGTPAGPPPLQPGDVCEIEIEGLGILRNTVELAPDDVA